MANKQAVLGSGARFTGKISNAKSIEINGYVEADLTTEKVTIGSTGKFLGSVDSELVVIAGEYEITDGPNDEGEMFTRDAKMSDKFVGPYENDKIARLANNGAYPPDLSLIVKARGGGADYIYSLLNGYKDFPENFEAS